MPLSKHSTKHDETPESGDQPAKSAGDRVAERHADDPPRNLAEAIEETGDIEVEKRAEEKRLDAAREKFQEKYDRLPITEDELNEFLAKK